MRVNGKQWIWAAAVAAVSAIGASLAAQAPATPAAPGVPNAPVITMKDLADGLKNPSRWDGASARGRI